MRRRPERDLRHSRRRRSRRPLYTGLFASAVLLTTGFAPVGTSPVAAAPGDAVIIISSWGNNGSHALGDGTSSNRLNPVETVKSGAMTGGPITSIDAGENHACAIARGSAYCWGSNVTDQLGVPSIATSAATPQAVASNTGLAGTPVTSISAGSRHTCAHATDIYCWGLNADGQLGDGTSTDRSSPTYVNTAGEFSAHRVSALEAGATLTCVVAAGKPYCWGDDSSGQLGNGPPQTSSPIPVPVLLDVAATGDATGLAVGGNSACVIAGGRPHCWGDNTFGQLGIGSTAEQTLPLTVFGDLFGKHVTDIAMGYDHTCVVADGDAYCWGSNTYGQLGDGTTTMRTAPVAVVADGILANKVVTSIETGDRHTCVIADARPYCWGYGVSGGLGYGWNADSPTPVAVDAAGALNGRVSIELGLGLGFSTDLAMTDPGFCDVAAGSPFHADVVWLNRVGLANGFSNGCFQPASSVSRQAMTAFLFRGFNPGNPDPVCGGSVRRFVDVPASNPFCGTIEWAANLAITSGYPDGTFQPSAPVSRQAMSSFVYRLLYPSFAVDSCGEPPFSDVPVDHPFCGQIEWLSDAGIAGGYDDDTFRPVSPVSRQAMAAFLHRALT